MWCHNSPFTQLVNDPHFAPLGLVLMAELSRLKRVIDVFMKKDTTMTNDDTARPGRDGSQLGCSISASSEDLGESIVRAGDVADPGGFEAHPSTVLDSQAGHDRIDSEPPQRHVCPSLKPPLSENTLKEADNEKRSLMSRGKGRSQDSANAIDRLFNGLI